MTLIDNIIIKHVIMNPLISIVTVCYNSLNMLKETVKSVTNQKYDNIEYIIIDGASSDGTKDWLKANSANITKWISEPDNGIYDAMNKAIDMAKGEWIIFMNAGDTFAFESTIFNIFYNKHYNGIDVIYGDVIKTKDGIQYIYKGEPPHNSHRMFFCHQSCFIKSSLLKKYHFNTQYKYSADFDLIKRLYLDNKVFKHIDIPVSIFDTNGVSNTKRSAGLRENINIVLKHDSIITNLKLLPRLIIPFISCKLRDK